MALCKFIILQIYFTDDCTHAHYALYYCAYFMCLIFADSLIISVKTVKIGPPENSPLYITHVING